MGYPTWQPGPAMSKQDRLAYELYCKNCATLWERPPLPIELYLDVTRNISVSMLPYVSEKGMSVLNQF